MSDPTVVTWCYPAPGEEDDGPASFVTRLRRLSPAVIGLGMLVGLRPLDNVWLVAVALCAVLLTLPGVLLLRALRVPAETVRSFPLYVPAASIFVVALSGLLADLAGPHLGVSLPLHGDTAELTTVGVCLGLWLLGVRDQDSARLDWFAAVASVGFLAPLALPLLAAAGALLLTNGHGAVVASITAVVLPFALAFTLLRANRLSRGQVAMLLFGCALAAEWAFSLRSQEIVGFDISTELGLAEHIHAAGIWHVNERGNAYGGMLSLTVFPAVLAQMVGISPLIAFKVLYPIFTAMLPAGIFLIASRHLQHRFAAAAASLLLVQYYFFEQLAEIGRQEVAMLFFIGLVAILLDRDTRLRTRACVVVVLGLGMVVSHYSTTYFSIIFFGLALIGSLLIYRWRPRGTGLSRLLALAFIVVAGAAAVFYGPVTHSATNLTSFTKILSQDGFDLFPSSSGGLIESYLNENTGYSASAAQFQHLSVRQFDRTGYIHPLKQAFQSRYDLQLAATPAPAIRLSPLASFFSTFNSAFAELMLLVIAIGTAWALFGKNRALRMAAMFSAAMILVLLVFRFSATLAAQYNQTRALLQGLLIISVMAGVLAERVAARFPRVVTFVVVAALFIMFGYQDGASWLVVRGGQPLNLADAGVGYQLFYETPAELAGATWTHDTSGGSLNFADEYGALRFEAATYSYPIVTMTPQTLDHHAWVYGTRTNIRDGIARGSVGSDSATYTFPAPFLDQYFDTVFDDGDTKVWHR